MIIIASKEEMQKTGVYQIRNTITNKIYIGSTTRSFEKRLSVHKSTLRKNKHYAKYLQRSWLKYGEINFEFSILEVCLENIVDREQYWLDLKKPYEKLIGYNNLIKAFNSKGFKHSEETLILLSQISQRRDKTKAVEAMNKSSRGLKRSPEHIEIISKTHSKKVVQLDLNGQYIKTWDSITQATLFLNMKKSSNISKCCNKKCKSIGGFMWVRATEYDKNNLYTYNPKINGKKNSNGY